MNVGEIVAKAELTADITGLSGLASGSRENNLIKIVSIKLSIELFVIAE